MSLNFYIGHTLQ